MWHILERGEVHVGFLVGGPEVRRPFGIHRKRWEDNITVDLQDTRLGVVDWFGLG